MKSSLLKSAALIAITALLINCSAKVESPQSVPPSPAPQGNDVGPFVIAFDTANTYSHSIKININQDEGFVEYKLNAGQRFDLVLDESPVAVTGCDAQTVRRTTYWLPDETNKTVFKALTPTTKFITGRKTTGVLIHSFKNIGTCTTIEIKTKITKETRSTRVGKVCDSFSSADQCKIESYCKEQFVSGWFYEVEVWNQQGTLLANKYLNKNDGTRTLSSTYTVKLTDATDSSEYKSTAADQYSLKINNL